MGRTILTILAIAVILHCLALVGLLGYGAATGRFDQEKRQQYLATWRGEKLVPPPAEVEIEQEEESPQDAGAKILAAQLETEVLSLDIQQYIQQLRNQKNTVVAAQAKFQDDIKEFQDAQEKFTKFVAEHNKKAQEEGFRKALKNYESMKADLVKDDFMSLDEDTVVRYLAAMKPYNATKILEKFSAPTEQATRVRLIEKLKQHGVIDLDNNNKFSKK
jgi:hypothetical protein